MSLSRENTKIFSDAIDQAKSLDELYAAASEYEKTFQSNVQELLHIEVIKKFEEKINQLIIQINLEIDEINKKYEESSKKENTLEGLSSEFKSSVRKLVNVAKNRKEAQKKLLGLQKLNCIPGEIKIALNQELDKIIKNINKSCVSKYNQLIKRLNTIDIDNINKIMIKNPQTKEDLIISISILNDAHEKVTNYFKNKKQHEYNLKLEGELTYIFNDLYKLKLDLDFGGMTGLIDNSINNQIENKLKDNKTKLLDIIKKDLDTYSSKLKSWNETFAAIQKSVVDHESFFSPQFAVSLTKLIDDINQNDLNETLEQIDLYKKMFPNDPTILEYEKLCSQINALKQKVNPILDKRAAIITSYREWRAKIDAIRSDLKKDLTYAGKVDQLIEIDKKINEIKLYNLAKEIENTDIIASENLSKFQNSVKRHVVNDCLTNLNIFYIRDDLVKEYTEHLRKISSEYDREKGNITSCLKEIKENNIRLSNDKHLTPLQKINNLYSSMTTFNDLEKAQGNIKIFTNEYNSCVEPIKKLHNLKALITVIDILPVDSTEFESAKNIVNKMKKTVINDFQLYLANWLTNNSVLIGFASNEKNQTVENAEFILKNIAQFEQDYPDNAKLAARIEQMIPLFSNEEKELIKPLSDFVEKFNKINLKNIKDKANTIIFKQQLEQFKIECQNYKSNLKRQQDALIKRKKTVSEFQIATLKNAENYLDPKENKEDISEKITTLSAKFETYYPDDYKKRYSSVQIPNVDPSDYIKNINNHYRNLYFSCSAFGTNEDLEKLRSLNNDIEKTIAETNQLAISTEKDLNNQNNAITQCVELLIHEKGAYEQHAGNSNITNTALSSYAEKTNSLKEDLSIQKSRIINTLNQNQEKKCTSYLIITDEMKNDPSEIISQCQDRITFNTNVATDLKNNIIKPINNLLEDIKKSVIDSENEYKTILSNVNLDENVHNSQSDFDESRKSLSSDFAEELNGLYKNASSQLFNGSKKIVDENKTIHTTWSTILLNEENQHGNINGLIRHDEALINDWKFVVESQNNIAKTNNIVSEKGSSKEKLKPININYIRTIFNNDDDLTDEELLKLYDDKLSDDKKILDDAITKHEQEKRYVGDAIKEVNEKIEIKINIINTSEDTGLVEFLTNILIPNDYKLLDSLQETQMNIDGYISDYQNNILRIDLEKKWISAILYENKLLATNKIVSENIKKEFETQEFKKLNADVDEILNSKTKECFTKKQVKSLSQFGAKFSERNKLLKKSIKNNEIEKLSIEKDRKIIHIKLDEIYGQITKYESIKSQIEKSTIESELQNNRTYQNCIKHLEYLNDIYNNYFILDNSLLNTLRKIEDSMGDSREEIENIDHLFTTLSEVETVNIAKHERKAMRIGDYENVDDKIFNAIKEKIVKKLQKFREYNSPNPDKQTLRDAYITRIEDAENLQQLEDAIFDNPSRNGTQLDQHVSHGDYRIGNLFQRSTSASYMNDIRKEFNGIIEGYQLIEALNNEENRLMPKPNKNSKK